MWIFTMSLQFDSEKSLVGHLCRASSSVTLCLPLVCLSLISRFNDLIEIVIRGFQRKSQITDREWVFFGAKLSWTVWFELGL